eukprot:scaffold813_cov313-Prasinococcus_capsulatus_cf.AAC.7
MSVASHSPVPGAAAGTVVGGGGKRGSDASISRRPKELTDVVVGLATAMFAANCRGGGTCRSRSRRTRRPRPGWPCGTGRGCRSPRAASAAGAAVPQSKRPPSPSSACRVGGRGVRRRGRQPQPHR